MGISWYNQSRPFGWVPKHALYVDCRYVSLNDEISTTAVWQV